jgi:uncharacterized membrane protein (DUF106 family)
MDISAYTQATKAQAGDVNKLLDEIKNATDDPAEMLKLSMDLMVAQQKLTIMSDSFSKAMRANTDAQKAAIDGIR